jgi:hypothetical protein
MAHLPVIEANFHLHIWCLVQPPTQPTSVQIHRRRCPGDRNRWHAEEELEVCGCCHSCFIRRTTGSGSGSCKDLCIDVTARELPCKGCCCCYNATAALRSAGARFWCLLELLSHGAAIRQERGQGYGFWWLAAQRWDDPAFCSLLWDKKTHSKPCDKYPYARLCCVIYIYKITTWRCCFWGKPGATHAGRPPAHLHCKQLN